jgi:hypothetical protein
VHRFAHLDNAWLIFLKVGSDETSWLIFLKVGSDET